MNDQQNDAPVKAITWIEWLELDDSWREEHLDGGTFEERVEAMQNYIHNLQHAGVDPEIFVFEEVEGFSPQVRFALHVPEYWDAIGDHAARAANEKQIREFAASLGIDPEIIVIGDISRG